jgi:hypothetical protein
MDVSQYISEYRKFRNMLMEHTGIKDEKLIFKHWTMFCSMRSQRITTQFTAPDAAYLPHYSWKSWCDSMNLPYDRSNPLHDDEKYFGED